MYDYEKCSDDVKKLINDVVKSFRKTLKDNLVGVYLHGSLAMGCFNPNYSDIDMLIVVEREMSVEDKRLFIGDFLDTIKSKKIPKKGIEFSVIQIKYLRNFEYPTPFELHYSKMWKEAYEQNRVDFSKQNRDPDLAAHIVVTLNRGMCLYGEPIDKVFKPIPEKFYVESILHDAKDIERNPMEDPVYSVLNFCRILYYLKEKVVSSKKEAGEWAIEILPEDLKRLVNKALRIYMGDVKEIKWDERRVKNFVEFAFLEVKRLLSSFKNSSS
ncbi:MAG TPA: DUF4111 domain-containing protein [Thermotoga sp.]|nr:DUF4111 domain-containing protein [Thermotoga sp.]